MWGYIDYNMNDPYSFHKTKLDYPQENRKITGK